MEEQLVGWIGTVSATFVGTGTAVLALRFLSGTLMGHWLAKGLAKYAARIETEETRRRVAIERLDRERAEAIAAIMMSVGEYSSLVVYPPATSQKDERGPEVAFLTRSREIQDIAQRVAIIAAKSAHLFEISENISLLCIEWSGHAAAFSDKYYDRIVALVDLDGHWQLQWEQRVTGLISAHQALAYEAASNKDLVDACRRLAAMP